MSQWEGALSELQISQVHLFGLDVFVQLVSVKGGNDYECIKLEWSQGKVI